MVINDFFALRSKLFGSQLFVLFFFIKKTQKEEVNDGVPRTNTAQSPASLSDCGQLLAQCIQLIFGGIWGSLFCISPQLFAAQHTHIHP